MFYDFDNYDFVMHLQPQADEYSLKLYKQTKAKDEREAKLAAASLWLRIQSFWRTNQIRAAIAASKSKGE